jgi:hypothetical protein
LAAVGLVLAILPAFMLAISPYHRGNIGFGVGWIPVLVQCYGVALVVSSGLWGLVGSWRLGGAGARGKCLAASGLLALVLGATYRANEEVTLCFVAQPETERFRAIVGNAGGGFHEQRWLLEAALNAGLMAGVPEGATVMLGSRYPFWYDQDGGRAFLAAHAGKSFRVTLASDGSPRGEAFHLRDEFRRSGLGYVVLSHRDASGKEVSPPRIFVRHPAYGRKPGGPVFRIEREEGAKIARSDLREVGQGSGWALYTLDATGESLVADSIRLKFDRPAVAEGDAEKVRR